MIEIKQLIKNHKSLWDFYLNFGNKYNYVFSYLFPVKSSKRQYKAAFARELNLKNPQTLNEKLMYLKLKKYWNNQLSAKLADKYAVREYIEKCGAGDILTKLYGVWDKAGDIDWSKLPDRFAIKCNHGSGYNLICNDKNSFDTDSAGRQLDAWMKERYGVPYTEQGIYNKINRKILAEEFIETSDGHPPKDYKFFCSYGAVMFLFVASDRYDGKTKFDYYEPNWEYIPVKNYFEKLGPQVKPANLDEMIHYAELISKQFPIIRVDLYSETVNEISKIYFGEITFTHFGCLNRFEPDEFDYKFGSRFPDVKELEQFELK